MANIGIIKEFDKLGRLVIPKDLRERYALDNKVEIVATEQGVLIKSPEYKLVKREEGDFSVVLNGEMTGTKTSAENLFSLPICGIMELTRSLPPR